jgi:hypothetical protein
MSRIFKIQLIIVLFAVGTEARLSAQTQNAPADSSYAAFLNLFTKVELPYTFHTDSIDQVGYPISEGAVADSPGNLVCRLIPAGILKNWLSDTTYAGPENELIKAIAHNPEFYGCSNPFCWVSYDAFIRIERPKKDIVFIMENSSQGNGNFGTIQLRAFTYSKSGKLMNIQKIGTYGWDIQRCNSPALQKYVDIEGSSTCWQAEYGSLNVSIPSMNSVHIIMQRRKDIQIQEDYSEESGKWTKENSYSILSKPEQHTIRLK